jgi:Domain of unknown function (DUF4116)
LFLPPAKHCKTATLYIALPFSVFNLITNESFGRAATIMADRVQGEIATVLKRQNEIAFKLKQLQTIEAKRQGCSNDVEEAICLLTNEFMDLREVLEHFDGIGQKREFWEAFLRSKRDIPLFKDFFKLISKYAQPLLDDRDLVLKLCAYNDGVYYYLSRDWKQDEGIVEAVLMSNPLMLKHLSEDVQQMYAALVASAIERLPLSIPCFRRFAQSHIYESLWANRSVALAWVSAGGNFLDSFPEEFKDDEELVVAFLQHDDDIQLNPRESQLKPTPRLLADKQFMLKAVKARPAYLAEVSKELAGDWDLLLAAMTNPRIAFLNGQKLNQGRWIHGDTGKDAYEFWIDTSKTVRDKLHAHDIFVKLMLGGMMASTGESSPLTLLNQGKETSLALTKPIAEYLGVPMGEELRMLREARKNLALFGMHWESSC